MSGNCRLVQPTICRSIVPSARGKRPVGLALPPARNPLRLRLWTGQKVLPAAPTQRCVKFHHLLDIEEGRGQCRTEHRRLRRQPIATGRYLDTMSHGDRYDFKVTLTRPSLQIEPVRRTMRSGLRRWSKGGSGFGIAARARPTSTPSTPAPIASAPAYGEQLTTDQMIAAATQVPISGVGLIFGMWHVDEQ